MNNSEDTFCFGGIIAKVMAGHLAEILESVSDKPCINLTFGTGDDWARRDFYGNTTKATKEERFRYI